MNLTYILKKKKDKVAADVEDLKVRVEKTNSLLLVLF
jgi:hypothetical protein